MKDYNMLSLSSRPLWQISIGHAKEEAFVAKTEEVSGEGGSGYASCLRTAVRAAPPLEKKQHGEPSILLCFQASAAETATKVKKTEPGSVSRHIERTGAACHR
ncbi:hypothetical protein AAC387_Pa02g0857 [Persea americana]